MSKISDAYANQTIALGAANDDEGDAFDAFVYERDLDADAQATLDAWDAYKIELRDAYDDARCP